MSLSLIDHKGAKQVGPDDRGRAAAFDGARDEKPLASAADASSDAAAGAAALELQMALDSAARVGRVAIVAVNESGRQLTEPSGVAGFCREARSRPLTAAFCQRAWRFGLDRALSRGELFAYFCPFGLMELVAPLPAASGVRRAVIISQARCGNAPPGLVSLEQGPLSSVSLPERDGPSKQSSAISAPAFEPVSLPPPSLEMGAFEAVRSDPVLKAFHEAAPLLDFQEVGELASLLSRTLPPLLAEPGQTGRRSDVSGESPAEAALAGLRLNPAFLVSAISAIANLAVIEGAWKTNRMAILLADHLKRAEAALSRDFRPLSDELVDVERYLAMQRLRYGDMLSYRIDSSPALGDLRVPTDALMPAVERAVFCGLASGGDKLEVSVASRRSGREIVVEVSDNLTTASSPMDELSTLAFQSGSEMRNIAYRLDAARERLMRLFGRSAGPVLSPAPSGGSVCRMRLPVPALSASRASAF